jgi:uncharacterized protein YbbC (DUF1343 family)/CubicO group peptidase (beta-lactamase class C family)
MDAAVQNAINAGNCPGGVLWFERHDHAYHQAYGRRAIDPDPEPMTADTIFDAASLTKVVATTPAVLILLERGQLSLDAPVRTYLPEFTGNGRDTISVRHLLTHTSGLRAGLGSPSNWTGYDIGVALACAERPTTNPGALFRYSDVNFILLGEVVRRASDSPLDEFTLRELYRPLRMTQTGFRPTETLRARIAPTTRSTNGVWRGIVHDPTARRMGGVAGHAGLFTTAADLARFARLLLREGELDGVRLFKAETIRLMRSVQTPAGVAARRALGWDLDSPYASPRGDLFPIGSYGHTGWTGTSIWIDPYSHAFLIFLSNRNHPTEDGTVVQLRRQLATLAAQAIPDFNFDYVPGALPPGRPAAPKPTTPEAPARRPPLNRQVLNGIDALARDHFAALRGLRIGLITNHTGHDRDRNPTIDLLHQAEGVILTALFSPEHGIRGTLDDRVADGVDPTTGLPVYSLYGERRQPTPEQLQGLGALVFDIQDIGCRFYTYISTLGLCLEAASQARLPFFVLDRVNPINGTAVEGPVHTGDSHFVAYHALPLRHGMTVGELARMFVVERNLSTPLTVIPLEDWQRDLWLDETGLPWTNPSPNMRTLNQATLYPGVGLLERALSVGRGTDTPFEIIGAPYADDRQLADTLNRAGLNGVRFIPIRFTPTASTFKDQPCAGVHLILTDRYTLNAVDLGITLIRTFQQLYPQSFAIDSVRHLLRHDATLDAIKAGRSIAEIRANWSQDLAAFLQRRQPFLLYP